MSADRYVVAGLAHVRSAWFTEVARWATVGSIPVEFVKCLSVEELRARVAAGRPFSAALLDGRLPAVDRDLLAALADRDLVTVVVDDGPPAGSWPDLGAAVVLAPSFSRGALLDALATHARPIRAVDGPRPASVTAPAPEAGWRAPLIAVTGGGGAGTSTVAAALTQGLAADATTGGIVVLADLALRAHQGILHDARDVVPGLQELVEAHRGDPPPPDRVRALTFAVPVRGYELLLGLRRHRDWVAIRAHAFAAALEGLRRASRLVVADVDRDLEGEAETGSLDVEDRNLLARRTVAEADLVMVVGQATSTGLTDLVHHLADLRAHGVPGGRLLTVLNRAPRRPRARAELSAALADLTGADGHPDPYLGPVFVPERRGVDELHRDLARFPAALAGPLAAGARAALDRAPGVPVTSAPSEEPLPIAPGSLGHWADEG